MYILYSIYVCTYANLFSKITTSSLLYMVYTSIIIIQFDNKSFSISFIITSLTRLVLLSINWLWNNYSPIYVHHRLPQLPS